MLPHPPEPSGPVDDDLDAAADGNIHVADGRVRTDPAGRETGAADGRLLRRLGRVALVLAVVPVWVAVVRAGSRGLYPYADGAETVLRARDVFDGPFPLVGMSAAGGSQGTHDVYFPGAWQLYAIALPTRVLGNVWGPLLAMGVLNTVWILLGGWLLLRRLRPAEALFGVGFLAALVWSVGSGYLITPVPMQMVVVPTATLLIAVWAVADADPVALPVSAVVANFLWLDHLVLVLTVPVLMVCAGVGLVGGLLAARHRGGVPEPQRRGLQRGAIAAGVITMVMWVPTVVQQLIVRPGNLWQLVANAGVERPIMGSWWRAAHHTISVIGRPPFWLRGSLDNPGFARRPPGPFVTAQLPLHDLIAWILVVGALVGLGIVARRRRDRTGLWLLIVAGVAVAVSVVTAHSAPNYLGMGPPTGYLRASWAVAMFVWFAIAVNVVRLGRGRFARATAAGVFAVVGVLTVANLTTASDGYGTDATTNRIVDELNRTVPTRLAGGGTFRIDSNGFDAHVFSAALALRLDEVGVPVCYGAHRLRSDGSRQACPDDVAGILLVRVADRDAAADDDVETLYETSFSSAAEDAELADLDEIVARWLAERDRLALSDEARADFEGLLAEGAEVALAEPLRELLAARGDRVASLADDDRFVAFVAGWYTTRGAADPPLFDDSPLTAAQWRRWMQLRRGDRSLTVTVR